MLHPRRGPTGLSPPLRVGPQDLCTQPSAPRGLLYSGKGMEVIHLGNCDCPFPGIGCACEVLAASLVGRALPRTQGAQFSPVARPDPVGYRALSEAEEAGAAR